MNSREIEFVFFDLGNVLVSFDPAITCRNVAERFAVDEAQAQQSIYDSGLQDRFEHGQLSGDQFADAVRVNLNLTEEQMPTVQLLEAISDMFTPIKSMHQVVRDTRKERRTGILSNTCHAHWDWIERQNWPVIDAGFEAHVLSYEVGAMKPDPRIYAAAEAAAGVTPSRILFLDDRAENVQAAIARGWQAVQCIGGSSAAQALRGFGVLS